MLLREKDKLNADDIARGTATEPTGCNDRDALVNQIKVQSRSYVSSVGMGWCKEWVPVNEVAMRFS